MTEALTNFTLNGTTFKYLNGSRSEAFLQGSIKQHDGARWNRIIIHGKAKERRITFSGFVDTDEQRVSLVDLDSDTIFTDYSDGIITFTNCVVMDLIIDFRVNSPYGFQYTIQIEEYNQS